MREKSSSVTFLNQLISPLSYDMHLCILYMARYVYFIILHPISGCRCPVDPLLNDVCHKYSWKNYLSYNASLRYTCIDGYHIANANHYPDEYGVRCLHNGTLRERKPQCVKGNVFELIHPLLIKQMYNYL